MSTHKDELNESFFAYALEIVADMALGMFLGVMVNIISDKIAWLFKLPRIAKLIVQIFLITVVLYIMKVDSKYLYSSWRGQTSYGIVFTAVFLASQKNIVQLFEDIYIEEENRIGIFGTR